LFESKGSILSSKRAKPRQDVQIGVGKVGELISTILAKDADDLWKFSLTIDGDETPVRGAELRNLLRGGSSDHG
jgi:hypothetical protein